MISRARLILVSAAAACAAAGLAAQDAGPGLDAAEVARGENLARIGNCLACHSAEDGAPLAGGRSVPTSFGVIHSTNITPDAQTGIGGWTL